MRRVFYALQGFSDEDTRFFKACAIHPRGWRSCNFDFVNVADVAEDTDFCAEITDIAAGTCILGITGIDGSESVVFSTKGAGNHRLRRLAELQTPQAPFCIVHLTSAEAMSRKYPQTFLRGLSVTDRSKTPIEVHLHADNWSRIPPGSEYTNLMAYRQHLVLHEWGHVLGYNHAACASTGAASDIMQQPSKPLGGCFAQPFVDGGSTAPTVEDSLVGIFESKAVKLEQKLERNHKRRRRSQSQKSKTVK